MLFQAGQINRLGTVEAGTTVSDWDEDEQRRADVARGLALPPRVAGREDQPASTRPATRASRATRSRALRVVEGALVVVSGVMGVEVQHRPRLGPRRGARALARRLREHARPRARRLLPGARAAPGAALRALRRGPPADRLRARADGHRRPAAHVRVHEPGRASARASRGRSRTRWPTQVAEYREKLLDAVVETDEGLMERYLDGAGARRRGGRARAQGRGHARRALPGRLRRRDEEPRHARAARPARRGRARRPASKGGSPIEVDGATARPRSSSRRSPTRSRAGSTSSACLAARSRPTRRSSTRATHAKERIGHAAGAAGQGARAGGRVRRRATSAPWRS